MPARRSEALLGGLEQFGMRLGLERVRALSDALGNPQLAVPAVLVAGTNGKGSTAALLASMCRAAGLRTGLYTSPHLSAVTERLKLDGESIRDRRLAEYLRRGLDAASDLGCEPPTYFEALTLAAFSYFRDAGVDLAVMEVGLGGRLDATNASEPVLSLITSIGLDHEAHLGDTLEAIAGEKCGVLRRGKPVIARAGDREVERVLRASAREAGADLVLADAFPIAATTSPGVRPQRARLRTARAAYEMDLHLAGRHQLANLAVAVLAAEVLAAHGWPTLDGAAIRAGAERCRWPGRLEWIDLGDRRVLLDAAHNTAGIEALLDYLDQIDERPDLLFGALGEKSIGGVLPDLAAASERVVLTRPPGERAAEPEQWRPFFPGEAIIEPEIEKALAIALDAGDRPLLVCGSLYLVGRVREMLKAGLG